MSSPVVESRPVYETITPIERRLILLSLGLGQFLAALDMTIVIVALPRILEDLGGLNELAWILSSYLLTSASVNGIIGRVSDVYGRRVVYLSGVFTFLLGSILCGVATSVWFLIVARGVQGIGGGSIMGLTSVVTADVVAPENRAKATSMIMSTFALASMSGPVIGGALVEYVNWRWVFFINIPITGLALVLLFFSTKKLKNEQKKMSLDYVGAVLIVAAACCFVLLMTWGGHPGEEGGYAWDDKTIIGLIIATAVLLVLFIFQELRHPQPVLKITLLKNRNIALAFGIMFNAYGAMLGVISYLPFYFQSALEDTALVSGLKTMPRSIGFVVGAILSAKLMNKGFRTLLVLAGAFVALASGLFGVLTPETNYGLLALFFILQGLGMGIQMPCATVMVQNSVSAEDTGSALSGFSFFGIIGGALYVAIYGSLYNTYKEKQLGDLNEYDPRDRSAWQERAPVVISHGVGLVCLACMVPAFLSSFLAMFIVPFEIVKAKGGSGKTGATVAPETGGGGEARGRHGEGDHAADIASE